MVTAKKLADKATEFYKFLLGLFEKYYWIFFAAGALVLAFYCFRCLCLCHNNPLFGYI